MFVFLTLNFPRSFYSAEYEILTVVWQLLQWKPNFWKCSFYGTWLYLSQSATIAHLATTGVMWYYCIWMVITAFGSNHTEPNNWSTDALTKLSCLQYVSSHPIKLGFPYFFVCSTCAIFCCDGCLILLVTTSKYLILWLPIFTLPSASMSFLNAIHWQPPTLVIFEACSLVLCTISPFKPFCKFLACSRGTFIHSYKVTMEFFCPRLDTSLGHAAPTT